MEGITLGGVVVWLIVGLIVGALAKLVMPGRDRGGIVFTIILGIVGALIGGFIGNMIGVGESGVSAQGFTWSGFLLSLIGAIILLAIYRAVTRRRPTV